MAPMRAFRRPTRSESVPTVSAPIIMPTRPIVMTNVAPVGVSPHSSGSDSVGTTVPTTTRSKPSSRTATQQRGATQPAARATVPVPRSDVVLTSGTVRPWRRARRPSQAKTIVRGPSTMTRSSQCQVTAWASTCRST